MSSADPSRFGHRGTTAVGTTAGDVGCGSGARDENDGDGGRSYEHQKETEEEQWQTKLCALGITPEGQEQRRSWPG